MIDKGMQPRGWGIKRVFSLMAMIAILMSVLTPRAAEAVTANDEFNPNVNSDVSKTFVQSDGKLLIAGRFTTVGGTSRTAIARLNTDGSVDSSFNQSLNNTMTTLAVQTDGKIVIGGYFTTVGGTARNYIARLNIDGSLDASFNPNANNIVQCIVIQDDGKILLGGYFTTVGGTTRNYIARLNADGTLDATFNPSANNYVFAITVQEDGKLIVGGWFTTVAGGSRTYLARLNSNGTLDGSFIANANDAVYSIEIQNDRKLLIGGWFSIIAGGAHNYIARLNSDGTIDASFNPSANDGLKSIAVQDDGKIIISGYFTAISGVARSYVARLNLDGTLDGSFNPDVNNVVYSVSIQSDGKIFMGGFFTAISGTARNRAARLNADGTLETTLDPNTNGNVQSIAIQPDGKILIGGAGFTTVGGVTRNNSALLNANGVLDALFDPSSNSNVYAYAVQPDGKILLGGEFTTIGGTSRVGIARINADGTLDASFNANVNTYVSSIIVQADGKILIGGGFTSVGGTARSYIALLNADGTLDASLNSNINNYINVMVVQPDGKIAIGGNFTAVGGASHNRIARINADGSVDATFNPSVDYEVRAISLQPDGNILIAGVFMTVNGASQRRVARLNADGTRDATFNPTFNNAMNTMVVQADGKIIIGGGATVVNGATRNYIVRLNADGSLDTAFDPNANAPVQSLAIESDGKILMGGYFTTVGGLSRNYIARVSATDAALGSVSLVYNNKLTWTRSGAAPEVDRTTFEYSLDGTMWLPLGVGMRVNGGWEIGGLNLPFNQYVYVRCLGYPHGGSLVESLNLFYIAPDSAAPTTTATASGYTFGNWTNSGAISVVLSANDGLGSGVATGYPKYCVDTLNSCTPATTYSGAVNVTCPADSTCTQYVRYFAQDIVTNTEALKSSTVKQDMDAPTTTPSYVGANYNSAKSVTLTCNDGSGSGCATKKYCVGVGCTPTTTYVSAISISSSNDLRYYSTDLAGNSETIVTQSYVIDTAAPVTTATPSGYTFGDWTTSSSISVTLSSDDGAGTGVATGYPKYCVDSFNACTPSTTYSGAFNVTCASGNTCTQYVRYYAQDNAVNAETIKSSYVNQDLDAPTTTVSLAEGPYTFAQSVTLSCDDGSGSGCKTTKYCIGAGCNPATDFSAAIPITTSTVLRYSSADNVGNTEGVNTKTYTIGVSANDEFNPNANGDIYSIAVQPDGKLLVGGYFTSIGGTVRNYIARLNTDGTLDTAFNPNANSAVRSIAVQADGKILIGGYFTTVGGATHNRIARLNADGTSDATFNTNANGVVNIIAIQADGKILLGGAFTTVGGMTRNYIARVNADGTLDTGFNPNANDAVFSIVIQSNGKILVGGWFTTVGGVTRNHIARLNADGSLDSGFNPNANDLVYSIAIQADGKILFGGQFTSVGATTRNHIARLNADATLDATFDPNANSSVWAITSQSDGKILIGGEFWTVSGTTRNNMARLTLDGTLDSTFNPNVNGHIVTMAVQSDAKTVIGGGFTAVGGTTRNHIARLNVDATLEAAFNPIVTADVFAIATQPDGKILIGGNLTSVGGVARNYIARLNVDGTLDTGFNPNANSAVNGIAVQSDGKILICGYFTAVGGTTRNGIARLNADGSLDTLFNPNANSYVISMALQTDGKILIAGHFTVIGGVARNYVARLNADGALDATFNPDSNNTTLAIAVQSDGKILIGGEFTTIGGAARNYIARFSANGVIDASFSPNLNGRVMSIAVQADNNILIAGDFTAIGGTARVGIARLSAAGVLEAAFNPSANASTFSMKVQADGKIIIGGMFTTIGGTTRNYIARLNANGTLDTTINPNANARLLSLALDPDGKIYFGGDFSTVGGVSRNLLARVTNTDAAIGSMSLVYNNKVTWLRSGVGPELDQAVFEYSTDGSTWSSLGMGNRISGGWELAGMNLPFDQNVYVRGRGYNIGGVESGSSSLIETVKLFYVKADNTAPTTSATPSGYTFGNWTNSGSISVTLASDDGVEGTGVAANYPKYCVDTNNTCTPSTTYSGAFNVTCSSGTVCTQYLRYFAQDNANNNESVKSSTVKQDLISPTTTPSVLGATYTVTKSVTLSCNDGSGSGCAGTKYCVGAGCTPTTDYSGAISIASSTDLRYYSTDNAGNTETIATQSYVIDTTAPTTTATPSGYTFGNWTNAGTVSVTLSADDGAGTGVAAGYPKYCVDTANSCTPTNTYSSAFNVTCSSGTTCTQYVRYYARDNATNNETIKSSTVKQDVATAPATNPSVLGGTYNTSKSVTLSCNDGSGSGCASTKYCIGAACTPTTDYSGAISIAASSILRYSSADNAGNAETVATQSYVIDTNAPTTTATPSGYTFGNWSNSGSISVTLSASDGAGSGVATNYPKYCLDTNDTCTPTTTYAGAFNVTCSSGATCTQYVRYFARDVAANDETVKSSTVREDLSAPTTTASAGGYTFGDGSSSGAIAVTLSSDDGTGSGVAAGYPKYCVDTANSCSPVTSYAGSFNVTCSSGSSCTQYVRYFARDNVTNSESIKSSTVIQSVPNSVNGTVTINSGDAYTKSSIVTLRLTATDNDGVVGYYKSNLNVAPTPSTTWTLTSPTTSLDLTVTHAIGKVTGTQNVYVWYKNRAGVISAVATDSIYLDTVLPTNGIIYTSVGNGLVELRWSGFADANSGVASYKIAYAHPSVPTDCSKAQISIADTNYTHTGLLLGTQYGYRICAVDAAGNVSKGATTTVTVKNDLFGKWALNELSTNSLPNTGGTWSGTQIAVSASGAATCSSYIDGNGSKNCSAIDTVSPIMLNPDGTLYIDPVIGGGAIKTTKNMMTWVKDDTTAGLNMMMLTKLGAKYSISNTAGNWTAYGINADPNYAKWYGFNQVINSTGYASCTGYGDSDGGANCTDWGINKFTIASTGILNSISNGTGVMNANKDMMTIVRTAPTGGYELAVLTKTGGTFTQADISGTWMAYGIKISADAPLWYYLKQTINSGGTATCVSYQDSDGSTDCGDWNGKAYTLGLDGHIANLTSGGGVMNKSKDMMVWVTDDGSGGYDLLVLQKML